MTDLHVLRVFIGPDGRGGNLLGIFLDGAAIPPADRQAVATSLGFSETVFVDDVGTARIRIFTPGSELPFAGHPTVGTAWLLREEGYEVDAVRPPAADVAVRFDGDLTWIRGRPEWAGPVVVEQLSSAADVEAHQGQPMGTPFLYVWAWEDEAAGRIRSRSFPTDYGIAEDEATGLLAVVMGGRLGRPLVIRQGIGSEILVRPDGDGWVEIGGRVELTEVRPFGQ